MKSATKTVRSACGRTLLIVGNRKTGPRGAAQAEETIETLKIDADRLTTEAEMLARVISEAGLPQELTEGEASDFRTDLDTDENAVATARRHRAEFAEKSLRILSPVSRIVYDRIAAALSGNDGVEGRIARGQNLLVVVQSPATDWDDRVSESVRAWLSRQAADRDGAFEQTCYVADESDRKFVDYAATIARLKNSHVILVTRPEKTIPAGLWPVVDATVWLTDVGFDDLRSAMRGRFSDADVDALVEPDGFSLTSIGAEFLDGAIMRAARASDVIALASEMSGMAARDIAARKTDEKPKLGSSKPLAIDVLRPTEPRLENLHGYGQAAAWAGDLVRDLADYRAGRLGWADVDSGCLLSGPPGTGKTLFASALAASAGLPFIASSFAQWQGSRGGHLGDVVKALRETFAAANANAPCILFIDELDSIPARGGSRDYDDYWIPIVNGLLECLDGTTRREGVVVLAASNHPEKIDPALLRSGRLDRRFEIGLPNERALASIFAHHLPGGDPAAFATAATVLAGSTSGADVSRIAREARRIARRAGREVEADDLLSIAMPSDTLSARDRRLAAVHEAGHAVAALLAGEVVNSISIVGGSDFHGGVLTSPRPHMQRVSDFERGIVMILAGRAAEEIILGEVSGGASEDLAKSTKVVQRMIGTLGLGARLCVSPEVSIGEVEARLRELYARALRLVTEHRSAVEALANLAIERRVLGRAALEAFAREHGLGGGR